MAASELGFCVPAYTQVGRMAYQLMNSTTKMALTTSRRRKGSCDSSSQYGALPVSTSNISMPNMYTSEALLIV